VAVRKWMVLKRVGKTRAYSDAGLVPRVAWYLTVTSRHPEPIKSAQHTNSLLY
jgi:hypothetical protein